MRYFRIFDEISDPEGDLYRWDGTYLRMQMSVSGKFSDHYDEPAENETLEEMLTFLAGYGRWEEVYGPA